MREDFKSFIPELDTNRLVILDESGFKLNMTSLYGRAPSGARLKSPAPLYAQNISVIGAMSLAGVLEVGMIEGTMNATSIETFIGDFLLPKLKNGDILVMDNAPVHNMKNIKQILNPIGVKILALPPYSPDLSPIEMLWSKVKTIVMEIGPRTIGKLYEALNESISYVEKEDIRGWFEHCGYEDQAI